MKVVTDHTVRPMAGEQVSGDAVLVRHDGDLTLLAVIDALGHGPKAEVVARAGIAFLTGAAISTDIGKLMNGLDDALRGGRGAAAMLCVHQAGRIRGCGVGNVELLAIGSKLPITLTPGIVGARMHRLRVFEGAITVGSRLVLYSDGISSSIASGQVGKLPLSDACRTIMERYRKSHDDSTVLVADVLA